MKGGEFLTHLSNVGDLLSLESIEISLDRLRGEAEIGRECSERFVELRDRVSVVRKGNKRD